MQFMLFTSLLALAAAAPYHKMPASQVTLRLVMPAAVHGISGNSIQQTLQPSNEAIHLAVGQTLSRDHAPLRIHAIKIASITTGKDLSSPRRAVTEDDDRVVCRARIGYGSEGWVFGMADGIVSLSTEDEEVDVTGLECWLEGDEGLIGGF